jgi:hypothetical protein
LWRFVSLRCLEFEGIAIFASHQGTTAGGKNRNAFELKEIQITDN